MPNFVNASSLSLKGSRAHIPVKFYYVMAVGQKWPRAEICPWCCTRFRRFEKTTFPFCWLRYSWRNVNINKYIPNSPMQFCAKIEPNYKLGVYYERISIFFISRRNKKITHILGPYHDASMFFETRENNRSFFKTFLWIDINALCLWCLGWYLSFCHFPSLLLPAF